MGKSQRQNLNVLVAHGVNLDLLGRREPEIYGTETLADLEHRLSASLAALVEASGCDAKVALTYFQSNDEAQFLARVSERWDGLLLNPGAWTHTSLALADRLRGLATPYVEVHISNLAAREAVRQTSFAAAAAAGIVYGFGTDSYVVGLFGLLRRLGAKCR